MTTLAPLASAPLTGGPRVAYFSMEIAIDPNLPTYSGGLGVLAGDTLRAAADLGVPMVAVTLLYRRGYFVQHLDADGRQSESPVEWRPETLLKRLPETVKVPLAGREVTLGAWRYDVVGEGGHVVPIVFLDADQSGNREEDRRLTDQLYGGDERYRLAQETLLGLGGVAMLDAVGAAPKAGTRTPVDVYHMNEGHAALLTLALMTKSGLQGKAAEEWVRRRCVFTTHTPVPAGHDTFPVALARELLGEKLTAQAESLGACPGGRLNMSELAIHLSRFVNGVAKRHGEVSRAMFPGVKIAAITNGVHAWSWTADAMRDLFDRFLPGWRTDNSYLRYAIELPLAELRAAHDGAKAALLAAVEQRTGQRLSRTAFTIGFARRATEYKRADLLFDDPAALVKAAGGRPLQIIFGGKAHPKDLGGKALIEKVVASAKKLTAGDVKVVYLDNYDMKLGRLITTGVDLWLNNPIRPLEASGTSGMKAAINGVPSLSTVDGWWVEGLVPGVTGWEIEDAAYVDPSASPADAAKVASLRAGAAASLYDRLGRDIIPLYYDRPEQYAAIMRSAIALNGSYFNTHRMVLQYLTTAYRSAPSA